MSRVGLATAAVLLFLSAWIVVPAPNRLLLVLGVGAPEVSPWLLVASALVCGLALRGISSSNAMLLAFVLAGVAAALFAWPLVQVPATLRTFDAAMREGGVFDPLQVPAGHHPLSIRAFVAGLDAGTPTIARGVAFAPGLTLDVYGAGRAGEARGVGGTPVIIQIYGGGWQRGAPDDDGACARYLASRGYVVFAPDYRHAPQSRWPAQIEDIRAALAWVVAHAADYGGDPDRIALVGRSAGAQLAMVAAYERSSPAVRAVVSYYGPVDLAEGWRHPPRPDPLDARSLLETYLGGTPDQMPDRYLAASPISYVSRDVPPTLLLYGSRDHIVEARFARELHSRLRAAGADAVLLEIPWAEHAFDAVPNGLSSQISLFYVERFLAWAMAWSPYPPDPPYSSPPSAR